MRALVVAAILALPAAAAADGASALRRADQVSLRNLSYHYDVPFRGSFAPVIASLCTHKPAGTLDMVINPAEIGFPYLDLPIQMRGTVAGSELHYTADLEVNACVHIPRADGGHDEIFVRRVAGRMRLRATELTNPIRTSACGVTRANVVSFSPMGGDADNYLDIDVNLGCAPPGLGFRLSVQGFTFFGNASVAPPVEGPLESVTVTPASFCQHHDARREERATGVITLGSPAGAAGVDVALTTTGGVAVGAPTVRIPAGGTQGQFDAILPATFSGFGTVRATAQGRTRFANLRMDIDLRPSDTEGCYAPDWEAQLPVIARPPPYLPGPDPDPDAERFWTVLERINPVVKPTRITVAPPLRRIDQRSLDPRSLPGR